MDSHDLIKLVSEDVQSLARVAPEPVMVAHVIGPRTEDKSGSYHQLCYLLVLKGESLSTVWYTIRVDKATDGQSAA